MQGHSVLAAALLLVASAQSLSAQGPSPESGLQGAVSVPVPTVFRDAVRGRVVDSVQQGAAVAPQRGTGAGELTSVPEPSSVAMLASGAVGLVGALWRRRQRR